MTKSGRKAWCDEERWREGKSIADRYLKEICSRLNCSSKQFIKMRRKTGIYRKEMIKLIVKLREVTEWTFRDMGKYFRYKPDYMATLYYDNKVETI
jgi:hypothetical protein